MPEGPSIKILRETLMPFIGAKIIDADGYAKGFDPHVLKNQTISDIKSWGKHLLICFHDFAVRIHMGLFGSYRINDRGKRNASLHMQFENGEINFYISNVKLITEPLDKVYDWSADLLSPEFDARKTRERLMAKPKMLICDALLNQDIFAGSGNIVKNEVLFRVKVHPLNAIEDIPTRKLNELIKETVNFCNDFYEWRKKGVLRKHLLAHEKAICPRNHIPFQKADLGKTKRHTYFCNVCQVLYK
ncbi:DNA-formamidopyrimidine glycosylase family protein [Mucilaginibacter boryungensis]|uniref:Endonuclease n=1 Tax=Mucilaginibacter boryungensis TaxID=768480 RepID=A0ABR9XMY1_9SPHI|nr:DNA-formamidopyrimidine glycosylase family protein [Mucilaginibacter boryungensis]MBE9668419.1 endonuclease [Mucilaginibacter boryungensis]